MSYYSMKEKTFRNYINQISYYKSLLKPQYKQYYDVITSLFIDRKIERKSQVEKLFNGLLGRGLAPKKAIKEIEKFKVKQSVKGIIKGEKPENWFLQAELVIIEIYTDNKTGKKRKYLQNFSESTVKFGMIKGVIDLYSDELIQKYTFDYPWESRVKKYDITFLRNMKTAKDSNIKNMKMKAVNIMNYNFIPEYKLYCDEGIQGECVINNFIGMYPELKLTREKFIDLCKKFYGNPLDNYSSDWEIDDGICPECIQSICKQYDIAHYAFDAMKNNFIRNISKSRNHKALFYYAMDNHMYLIKDEVQRKSLKESVKGCVKSSLNVSTSLLESKTINKLEKFEIYENIDVNDYVNYKESCNIIYSRNGKHNINDIYESVIEIYNEIPESKYIIALDNNIIYFQYKLNDIWLYIYNDNNDVNKGFNYKMIHNECKHHEIEFKNQTFITFIKQLRDKMFSIENERIEFTSTIKSRVYKKCNSQCTECYSKNKLEIDHIRPLANGGKNDLCNLQLLCSSCHKKKTIMEKEEGTHIKIIDSESSYNNKVKLIMESDLAKSYAFIQHVNPSNKKLKYFHIDINKCRKNILMFGEYDYPVFTCMDNVEVYNNQTGTGIYYVETDNTFPLRGNGWYYYNTIDFCLLEDIIQPSDIKYTIQSSLSIPKDKYNKFITFCYDSFDEATAKFAINSMIGSFAINTDKRCVNSLIHVTKSSFEAFQYLYKYEASNISTLKVGDQQLFSIFKRDNIMKIETEANIYNQIVQDEAIELYKLVELIKSKNGLIIDYNTDAVCCQFPDNEFPFELESDGINIRNYYYPDSKHMYKLEKNKKRLKNEKMPNMKRTEKYTDYKVKWNIINDVDDNNFNPLVQTILNSNKSINIDGMAGAGKSTLIKLLQKEMDKKELVYFTTAPTNKACNIVNGVTLNRFMTKIKKKTVLNRMNIDYIFVDEISMVKEIFYKFLLMIKRAKPNVKFIICGDFKQLKPVLDRINCDYEYSLALFELCDGQRLQLSNCRRSDDKLFNMCKNINSVNKSDFKNEYCKFNIAYTNKKRIEVNDKIMMEQNINDENECIRMNKRRFDENSQDVILSKGTPLISNHTNDKFKLIKNELYTIDSINKNIIKFTNGLTFTIVDDKENLKEFKLTKDTFQKFFYVAYCITTHKSQGSTYNFPYTIHEWDIMDNTLKYVALSRSTNVDNINII